MRRGSGHAGYGEAIMKHVRSERSDGAVAIILDRPPVNVLDIQTMEEMREELHAASEIPDLRDIREARKAAAMLLHHWNVRGKKRYFGFGIGTDFAKPKAPLLWYDIMHYVDTLTRIPYARRDSRLQEALELLVSKADGDGRLTPASVWKKWVGWEFGQTAEPSFWLTFLLHRIVARVDRAA